MAVVLESLMLRTYLEAVKFVMRADQNALRWMMNMSDTTVRQARWRLRLFEIELEVVYRAVIVHQDAYALSRLPTTQKDTFPIYDDIPVLLVDHLAGNGDPECETMFFVFFDLDGEQETILSIREGDNSPQ